MLLREQEKNEIKNEIKNKTKRKVNILHDEINSIFEKLDVTLTTLVLEWIFCEEPDNFEKERELRLSAKENINIIEGLKEEVENKED